MLGVTQEQHPDRCRLFAQWKQFEWPILHDPINVLGLRVVPVILAIDEHGIVRSLRPRVDSFADDFMKKRFPAPENVAPGGPPGAVDWAALESGTGTWQGDARLADACVLWGRAARTEEAVDYYQRAVQGSPSKSADRGELLFRLGVARLMRYESERRRPDDFQGAVDCWQAALDIDPNHYIRRRRIQQYGPRLQKPYPFYDWIETAQRDLRKRGVNPVHLATQLTGAEIAAPRRQLPPTADREQALDPEGKIARDPQRLAACDLAVVPPQVVPGGAVRVHLTWRPQATVRWNNESGPLEMWVDWPPQWQGEHHRWQVAGGPAAETRERRRVELELHLPRNAKPGTYRLPAYALYYVCSDSDGVCRYLRQDVPLQITVVPAAEGK